jgi:uncharacterized protein (DUF1330 family)/uncharacterized protein YjiS (DUF1127 family)
MADEFLPRLRDQRLTASHWTALRQAFTRNVHIERGRMIRSAVRAAIAAVWAGWRRLNERQQARAALQAMRDVELRDIGITRAGIEAAIRSTIDAAPAASGPSTQTWRSMMSKAYWIVRVSVHDEARYPDYLAAAKPAFEKFGAKFIVRGGAFEAMEGHARDRNVVVEFADRATAMACYRSPEYDAAKAIRQQVAEADFIIIDGA